MVCGNKSANDISKNSVHHSNTKLGICLHPRSLSYVIMHMHLIKGTSYEYLACDI